METHSREAIWNETLALIGARLNEGTFRIWFAQTAGLGFVDGAFVVGVSSDFAKDWIETRFLALIQDALSEVLGDAVTCRLVVDPSLTEGGTGDRGETTTPRPGDERATDQDGASPDGVEAESGGKPIVTGDKPLLAVVVPGNGKPAAPAVGVGLSEKYTFDSFVIGPSNRFAHAAALAAAETPGTRTTRSSSTAASASARPTSCRPSATTSSTTLPG